MKWLFSAILAVGLAIPILAEDIPLQLKGDTEVVKVDRVIVVKEDRTVVKTFPAFIIAPPDIGFYYWTYPATVKATDKGNTLQIDSAPQGDVKVNLKVQSAVVVDGKIKYVTQFSDITFAVGAPTPPIPPTPVPPTPIPPTPVPPTPVPVTSFHVIFVFESGKTLTSAQLTTMDAKVTRDYLTANTTPEGGFSGWRKYDKDQVSTKDTPTIDAMWKATQPKVTAVPCVAIEANGKVDILPLEATPAAQVEVFKRYKSGGA